MNIFVKKKAYKNKLKRHGFPINTGYNNIKYILFSIQFEFY